jgi:pyridoxamine 5'-phosphate oxidase family protein
VIDDLVSTDPWTPRYLRVCGAAELIARHGQCGNALYVRITPTAYWNWTSKVARSVTTDRST